MRVRNRCFVVGFEGGLGDAHWIGKRLRRWVAAICITGMVLLAGCGTEDRNNDGGRDDPSGIVGDWLLTSVTEDGITTEYHPTNEYDLVSIQSSGRYAKGSVRKIGNDWVESFMFDFGWMWRMAGDNLYVTWVYNGIVEEDTIPVLVSGDNLIFTNADDGRRILSFTRIDLAELKRSLGTVYTQNPTPDLRGDWQLSDSDEYIQFSDGSFFCGERYINNESIQHGYWYTNDSKLILVNYDYDDYTFRVELNYTISGFGANKTLTINNDTWVLIGN